MYDSIGSEALDRGECLRLLGSVSIGRIIFTEHALPAAEPVNFALLGDAVVFRTAAGSRLAAAARNAVVAFEADEFDPATHTGWSVLVVGHAAEIRDPGTLSLVGSLPLRPWVVGQQYHVISVSTDRVSGRRFHRATAPSTERAIHPSAG